MSSKISKPKSVLSGPDVMALVLLAVLTVGGPWYVFGHTSQTKQLVVKVLSK